ncbi:hypothetical protein E4U58_002576 [Claviceps cyperi]|nr:hypothetical protein E4U58_002576 [Claviceps cyperi]
MLLRCGVETPHSRRKIASSGTYADRDTRPGLLMQSLVAVRPRPLTPTRPAIRSAFLTCDDGHLQYHRPRPRSGEPLSQAAERNVRERMQRLHRSIRRDSDAQPPSLIPTASEMYARGNRFTASSTLRQSGGPDFDDVFAPTSARPRESIAPSARSSQYHSATGSDESEAETDVVPIFRQESRHIFKRRPCTRTQFPLTVAYAITVHKSVCTTLDRAVVDVSAREFTPGLSYVAVSRVKTLGGIMFDAHFDHTPICARVTPERDPRRADAVRRQNYHLPADADEVD